MDQIKAGDCVVLKGTFEPILAIEELFTTELDVKSARVVWFAKTSGDFDRENFPLACLDRFIPAQIEPLESEDIEDEL